MSDQILAKLDELKAGQNRLERELLQAIRESNSAVVGAIQALHSEVRGPRSRIEELERRVS